MLRTLLAVAEKTLLEPKRKHYHSVQIDELWSYVGQKRQKCWIVYAYAPETDEILAYVIGKRNAATVRKLYQKLKNLQIDTYCTDE